MLIEGIFVLVVVLLTILSIGGIAFASHLTVMARPYVAPGLIYFAVVAGLLSNFSSGRVLYEAADMLGSGGTSEAGGTILSKAILAFILALSFSAVVGWIVWQTRQRQSKSDSPNGQQYGPDRGLIYAFIFFFVCYGLVPLVFAPDFYFRFSLVYPIFFFLAVLLYLPYSRIDPIRVVMHSLFLICLFSLIAAVARPQVSVLSGYRGLLPGFSFRLYGLTAHPNSLGFASASLFVLAMAQIHRATMPRFIMLVVAASALLLSQSKTSILACAAGVAVLLSWRLWTGRIGSAERRREYSRILLGRAVIFFLLALTVVGSWFLVADSSFISSLLRALDQREVGRLETFTGRIGIWRFALDSATSHPWFGYGLGLWTDDNRTRTGLLGASSAHNLFLEVLVRSGVLGLVALFILLGVMLKGLMRSVEHTSAASIALLVIFLVRAVFEVSLHVHGVIGSEVFAFLALLICSARSASRVSPNSGMKLAHVKPVFKQVRITH